MEPGGGMPKHTNAVEHEQYVLTGRAKVGIGEKVYSVEAGGRFAYTGGNSPLVPNRR